MFMGEMLCLIPAFFSLAWGCLCKSGEPEVDKGEGSFKKSLKAFFSFAVPAMCDVSGTTLLNVGIFFTYPSVYQMLRGTVVFFAGMFTYSLLGRRLSTAQWFSLVLIVIGAGIVGAVSVMHFGKHSEHQDNSNATNPMLGNILVVSAQVAAAFQFIVEEKYLAKYGVKPHVAVGLEGIWGFSACMILLPIMAHIKSSSGRPFDDLPVAIEQIKASRPLLIATLGSIFSIAFFNFFGITLTKRLSGASRATIDACRTLFVWMYSLHVGWEEKGTLKITFQVLGFLVLISGTSMFNGIIRGPGDKKKRKKTEMGLPRLSEENREPLLPSALGQISQGSKSQGGAMSMRRLVSNTMARSFRLGRSLLSPASSRVGSVANTPAQTPRYANGGSDAMVFGSVGPQSYQELPSSYESKVVLSHHGHKESISEEIHDNAPHGASPQGIDDGDMEEPFE